MLIFVALGAACVSESDPLPETERPAVQDYVEGVSRFDLLGSVDGETVDQDCAVEALSICREVFFLRCSTDRFDLSIDLRHDDLVDGTVDFAGAPERWGGHIAQLEEPFGFAGPDLATSNVLELQLTPFEEGTVIRGTFAGEWSVEAPFPAAFTAAFEVGCPATSFTPP